MVTSQASLALTGVSCAACAPQVEALVGGLDGVVAVSLNGATRRLSFSYDPAKVDVTAVEVALRRAGFGTGTSDEEVRDGEVETLQRLLWFAGLMCLPFMWGLPAIPQLVIATAVQVVVGRPFYSGAARAVRARVANMDVLIALGTSVIYLYSAFMLFTAAQPRLYFDCGVMLLTLILLGKYFEALARGDAAEAIRGLLANVSATAVLWQDGTETEVPIEAVHVGDTVVVRPGGKIPADGVVLEGETYVDESVITGEAAPVARRAGEEVIGATYNQSGHIKVQVRRTGSDSLLAQIVTTMEAAQAAKAPIQRLVDTIASYFVPTVVVIAALTFAYWVVRPGADGAATAVLNASAVMVIACPCALGLATPMAILEATSRGADHGILVRAGESLELLHKVGVVVFDKTGTLTTGVLRVTDARHFPAAGVGPEECDRVLRAVEGRCGHPVARALRAGLGTSAAEHAPARVGGFTELPGRGARAVVDGRDVLVGTPEFMRENGVDTSPALRESAGGRHDPVTEVYQAVDGRLVCAFELADTLREDAREVIAELRGSGVEVWMLTGDGERAAALTAGRLGIDHVVAGVLPTAKAATITELRSHGRVVAMVGDGVNDAPALVAADVGIAMGNGTDIAIESADVVLLGDNLENVPRAVELSRLTLRNARQSLFLSLVYNAIGIPLAAVGLLDPLVAGAAMSVSSVSVVCNALRLKKTKLR